MKNRGVKYKTRAKNASNMTLLLAYFETAESSAVAFFFFYCLDILAGAKASLHTKSEIDQCAEKTKFLSTISSSFAMGQTFPLF